MTRVYVFCEGQTEESFVKRVLKGILEKKNIDIIPIIVRTSTGNKGGISKYSEIKKQISRLCREHQSEHVTTMLDYYGLPQDFPGAQSPDVGAKEKAFSENISHKNFIPYLSFHEFEAILFSDLSKFRFHGFEEKNIKKLKSEIKDFDGPESINNSRDTAPSKRILKYFPSYNKVSHGTAISLDIGLDDIRSKCPHFNEWLIKLEKLGQN